MDEGNSPDELTNVGEPAASLDEQEEEQLASIEVLEEQPSVESRREGGSPPDDGEEEKKQEVEDEPTSLNDLDNEGEGIEDQAGVQHAPAIQLTSVHDDTGPGVEEDNILVTPNTAQNAIPKNVHHPSPPHPDNETLWPRGCDPSYRMPDVVSVVILEEEGGPASHEILLHVEKFIGTKPYLGGYRHALTRTVYHHASTQFGTEERKYREVGHLRTRETQTFEAKACSSQTRQECGTQMERKDLLLSKERDREMRPSAKYISADECWETKRRCAILMQRYWRGCSARGLVQIIRSGILEKDRARENEQERIAKEEARRQEEMDRMRRNPRTATDFKTLYSEVETWREQEAQTLSTLGGNEKSIKGSQVLAQETRVLQTIERLKSDALAQTRKDRIDRSLQLMGAPKRWELSDGQLAEVHTPWTLRAAELREMYAALGNPDPGAVNARLTTLLNVKWTVQEFDCQLTREISELVDREADLLQRGRSEKSLAGLRQRISRLFVTFMSCPEFNPEAARFLKVPMRSQIQSPLIAA